MRYDPLYRLPLSKCRAIGAPSGKLAESRVHGGSIGDIELHEVGAWDSIVDIVGARHFIAALEAESWTDGLGWRTARYPFPAPASALSLEGFLTIDEGVSAERVTPTGTAILRYLCAGRSRSRASSATGPGIVLGSKALKGVSNCLRVLAIDQAVPGKGDHREIVMIEFEVDINPAGISPRASIDCDEIFDVVRLREEWSLEWHVSESAPPGGLIKTGKDHSIRTPCIKLTG